MQDAPAGLTLLLRAPHMSGKWQWYSQAGCVGSPNTIRAALALLLKYPHRGEFRGFAGLLPIQPVLSHRYRQSDYVVEYGRAKRRTMSVVSSGM